MIQRKQSSRNNLNRNTTKTLVNKKRSSSSGRKIVDENVSQLYNKKFKCTIIQYKQYNKQNKQIKL